MIGSVGSCRCASQPVPHFMNWYLQYLSSWMLWLHGQWVKVFEEDVCLSDAVISSLIVCRLWLEELPYLFPSLAASLLSSSLFSFLPWKEIILSYSTSQTVSPPLLLPSPPFPLLSSRSTHPPFLLQKRAGLRETTAKLEKTVYSNTRWNLLIWSWTKKPNRRKIVLKAGKRMRDMLAPTVWSLRRTQQVITNAGDLAWTHAAGPMRSTQTNCEPMWGPLNWFGGPCSPAVLHPLWLLLSGF